MDTHHEASLLSSGFCHSKEHYCLDETLDPPGRRKEVMRSHTTTKEVTMELYTHRFTEDVLHQPFDDLGGRGQNGGLVLRLAGFQDGVEIESPVGHVLTHAEEEAVEVVTQLDWLRAKRKGEKKHLCDIALILDLNIKTLSYHLILR